MENGDKGHQRNLAFVAVLVKQVGRLEIFSQQKSTMTLVALDARQVRGHIFFMLEMMLSIAVETALLH